MRFALSEAEATRSVANVVSSINDELGRLIILNVYKIYKFKIINMNRTNSLLWISRGQGVVQLVVVANLRFGFVSTVTRAQRLLKRKNTLKTCLTDLQQGPIFAYALHTSQTLTVWIKLSSQIRELVASACTIPNMSEMLHESLPRIRNGLERLEEA